MDLRVGKYKLGRKIGAGSFGDVFIGTHVHTGEEFAVKIESIRSRHPQLLHEAKLYKILAGRVGIPKVYWYGVQGNCNVMVIELLDRSLEDLFVSCKRKFNLKTVLMLADQMIDRLALFHHHSFIHRDIKPDNFMMGCGRNSKRVYLIDVGLAKKFRNPCTHEHIPFKEGKALTGTARYASVNTHFGFEQSRRDDLESLGYVLMYFNTGGLPWQGLQAKSKQEKYEQIMHTKMSTTPDGFCSRFPEFNAYLTYCRSLRFEEKPDYAFIKDLFKDLFFREGYKCDFTFDWTVRSLHCDQDSGDVRQEKQLQTHVQEPAEFRRAEI